MSESERLSRAFYEALGAEGLAARTTREWDQAIVARVLAMLPPHAHVLDVGCGYGRVAVPLARKGHRVEGIDVSPVLIEAALSFLGFGISQPEASLGNMLTEAQTYFFRNPWLVAWPGIVLILIVVSASFLGDGLRDALDPRQK